MTLTSKRRFVRDARPTLRACVRTAQPERYALRLFLQ